MESIGCFFLYPAFWLVLFPRFWLANRPVQNSQNGMAVREWIWDFGKPIRFLPKSVSAYHYHSGKSCAVLCKWWTIWSECESLQSIGCFFLYPAFWLVLFPRFWLANRPEMATSDWSDFLAVDWLTMSHINQNQKTRPKHWTFRSPWHNGICYRKP
jgi:hypothetical protein